MKTEKTRTVTPNQKAPIWLRFLPPYIRNKLEQKFGLQRALENTGWLFVDKVVRAGVGLLVLLAMARYLGPEQFGMLNYALAYVALYTPIANLGLAGIVIRDLTQNPKIALQTLGTAFVLQISGGILAFALATVTISYIRLDEPLVKFMVAIIGAALVFKATDVVKWWYESHVLSKYTVWAESSVFLLFSGVKLLMVAIQASLIAFAWTIFMEAVWVSIALICIYGLTSGNLNQWKFQLSRAKELLAESWPLIFSGIAIIAYMRIDQIMIGHMLGNNAVGTYSAAVRISEAWYFVPMSITASVFPAIIKSKAEDEDAYRYKLQRLYNLLTFIAISAAIPLTVFADPVIALMFGLEYSGSGIVLAIHIWSGVFVVFGIVSSKWLLLEKMRHHVLYRTCLGLLFNITANLLLIPPYGIVGAAIATLGAQLVASFIYDFFHKDTRPCVVFKTSALAFPFLELSKRIGSRTA